MPTRFTFLFLVACISAGSCELAHAQSGANVLLVTNESSPDSIEIGNYYTEKRAVPVGNIIRLRVNAAESVDRPDYERLIEGPIASWFSRNFAQDRILYIVLTKGIPLRISGTSGPDGTVGSVDSELALLYRKLTGISVPPSGRINNPYFLGDSTTRTKPFTHENYDIYLVTRLDGYTVADVRGLIDRASTPTKEGDIVLDDKEDSFLSEPNPWLKTADANLKAVGGGHRIVYDTTPTVVRNLTNVLGYYSWGSNDPAIHDRNLNLKFVNGALAALFVSTDARTMNEPPSDWKLGRWEDATTHFAGSPQSLTGDFIRNGVTGTAGHVAEPYLDAAIRPNILFPAYLSGANLAEAFYQAMPYLGWQTVVIGDPLSGPFRSTVLQVTQIEKGIDPTTEFPQFFSARRLNVLSSPSINPDGVALDVIKLLMRADARGFKQDVAGVRQFLEQAIAREKRLVPATISLTSLYEQAGEYDKAIERYRGVLEINPGCRSGERPREAAAVIRNLRGNPESSLPHRISV